ncbi:MAG: hypothetical protein SOH65_05935 [Bifidobacterium sp.]|jgi:hypothetical protein
MSLTALSAVPEPPPAPQEDTVPGADPSQTAPRRTNAALAPWLASKATSATSPHARPPGASMRARRPVPITARSAPHTALTRSARALRSMERPQAAEHDMPMVLGAGDLPGPMSLTMLTGLGVLHRFDGSNAYRAEHAGTLFGRGMILAALSPSQTVACALSAAWVWLGGAFPDSIDIISSSNFRSMVVGRAIRVFNRKAPRKHLTAIGELRVTNPLRTACDIALLSDRERADIHASEIVCALIEEYRVKPSQCLALLEENRFWHNAPQARQFFMTIEHCY